MAGYFNQKQEKCWSQDLPYLGEAERQDHTDKWCWLENVDLDPVLEISQDGYGLLIEHFVELQVDGKREREVEGGQKNANIVGHFDSGDVSLSWQTWNDAIDLQGNVGES